MRWLGLVGLSAVTVGCVAQQRTGRVSVIDAASPSPATTRSSADAPALALTVLEEHDENETRDAEDEVLGANAVKPCLKGTAEQKGAEAALDAISAKIDALDDKASAKALTAELTSLLDTPCFELARRDHDLWGDTLEFDSGLALKAWWSDGERWLREYGSLATSRWLSMPATPRHSLFFENHKTHALAPLLCPATPGDCGKETIGWVRRTEKALKRDGRRFAAYEDCDEKVKSKGVAASNKYVTYLQCKKDQTESHDALPLGRFKAPADGLFVIEGRSPSSTSFRDCKELRVYDLATGAAQVAEDCPIHSWSSQAKQAPYPRVTTGKVPVAALREALFMVMFASTVDTQIRSSEMIRVPDGVVIGRSADEHLTLHGFGFCGGGSRVIRPWSWMRKDPTTGALRGQVSGRLITPASRSAATDHASELMGVFEDGFVAGCSPKMTSASSIPWSKPGATLSKDDKVELDRVELEGLRAALLKAPVGTSACASAP